MGSHFNTTNETGQTLIDYEAKAQGLERVILNWFQQRPKALKTPFEIKQIIDKRGRKYPITSYRRALTNLSGEDYGYALRKTQVKLIGDYGRPNHAWTLNNTKD